MDNTVNQVSFGRVFMTPQAKETVAKELSYYGKNQLKAFEEMLAKQEFNPVAVHIQRCFEHIGDYTNVLKAKIGNSIEIQNGILFNTDPLKLIRRACKIANSEHAKLDVTKSSQEQANELLKNISEYI